MLVIPVALEPTRIYNKRVGSDGDDVVTIGGDDGEFMVVDGEDHWAAEASSVDETQTVPQTRSHSHHLQRRPRLLNTLRLEGDAKVHGLLHHLKHQRHIIVVGILQSRGTMEWRSGSGGRSVLSRALTLGTSKPRVSNSVI